MKLSFCWRQERIDCRLIQRHILSSGRRRFSFHIHDKSVFLLSFIFILILIQKQQQKCDSLSVPAGGAFHSLLLLPLSRIFTNIETNTNIETTTKYTEADTFSNQIQTHIIQQPRHWRLQRPQKLKNSHCTNNTKNIFVGGVERGFWSHQVAEPTKTKIRLSNLAKLKMYAGGGGSQTTWQRMRK